MTDHALPSARSLVPVEVDSVSTTDGAAQPDTGVSDASGDAADDPPEVLGPDDAPVPLVEGNRWTPEKVGTFLDVLAATQSVAEAARRAGMSRQAAYRLRAREEGRAFDFAWEQALHFGFDQLAQAALDRALNGVEVPHYYHGELVGTSRRYDEKLTMALLKARSHRWNDDTPRHTLVKYDEDLREFDGGIEDWITIAKEEAEETCDLARRREPREAAGDVRSPDDQADCGPRLRGDSEEEVEG